MSTLLRHHSTSAIDQHSQLAQAAHAASAATGLQGQSTSIALDQTPLQRVETGASEQRWIHRLKEMERRLKAEREARLLDRRGARQRLEERSAENEELRMMLEREKRRESYGGGGAVGGGGDESGSGAEDEFFDRRGGVGERM
jgi:uncharacterized membrane protein YgcG